VSSKFHSVASPGDQLLTSVRKEYGLFLFEAVSCALLGFYCLMLPGFKDSDVLDWITNRGMAPYDFISGPNVHHPIPVQIQPCDRCPSGRCHTDDGKPIGGPNKVLTPGVSTRVEQRNFFARLGVDTGQPVGFPAVAVKTGQSEIIGAVKTTLGQRDDMIYCESYVLPPLRGMTVFA